MKGTRNLIIFVFLLGLLDILAGFVFLPHTDILFGKVRILHPYYNHGFLESSAGVVGYGSLRPTYHINSSGMKDNQVRKVERKTAKHRILFIGDSFTEGVGYPYDSTFCGYLQSQIDTSKTEILNAGVASFSPKLYYLRLDYLFNHEGLETDELYIFLDYSDVSDELFYQDFQAQQPDLWNGLAYGVQRFYRNHSLLYYFYSTISIEHFMKANNLDRRLEFLYWLQAGNKYNEETGHQFLYFKGHWINDEMISLPVTKKAIKLAHDNLTKIFALCEQHHIKVHVVVYPVSDQVYDGVSFDQIKSHDDRYISLWQDMVKERNVEFINLFPLFVSSDSNMAVTNKRRYYIPGDSHWNAQGHKKVADSLYCIINK